MSAPHVWLRSVIEDATDVSAFPVEATGATMPPYVVYTRESTSRDLMVLSDAYAEQPSADYIGPVATFLVTIYADSYVQAWDIAGLVANAAHKVSATSGGLTLYSIVEDEKDGSAGYLDGREQPVYTVEQTIRIRFEE
mgnify:CR=1 FL=1